MSDEFKTDEQVAKQCDAIVHMCKALIEVHSDYARMFREGTTLPVNQVGRSTAWRMETLGDMLNGMDAVTDEDEFLDPVFEEAHRRWPQNEKPAP